MIWRMTFVFGACVIMHSGAIIDKNNTEEGGILGAIINKLQQVNYL